MNLGSTHALGGLNIVQLLAGLGTDAWCHGNATGRRRVIQRIKGAITSKIKHAIKLKTSPARLAQMLHNCSSPGRYAVIGCNLKQNANEGCNSCASLAGLV